MAGIIQRVYDETIRPVLPRKWCVYGDVPARDARLLDFTDHVPNYKQGLKRAIDDTVEAGDTVTVVGGGRGVSSVWLARRGAEVLAYEAAAEMVDIARETVAMQDVADAVTFRHALVGEAVDVYGSAAEADRVPPSELRTHDVLVLDCEGAEVAILEGLSDWPEAVIVETHPGRGAPTAAVRDRLSAGGRDYAVGTYQYEPGRDDKYVLRATVR